DLDLAARRDLTPLVDALAPRMHVLFNSRVGRVFRATLELGGLAAIAGHPIASSPDRIIRRMVQLVEKLPRRHRADWDDAKERCFNLGFECGETRLTPVELKASTAQAIAQVRRSIALTLYPQERGK